MSPLRDVTLAALVSIDATASPTWTVRPKRSKNPGWTRESSSADVPSKNELSPTRS